jgi:hypothetical protein
MHVTHTIPHTAPQKNIQVLENSNGTRPVSGDSMIAKKVTQIIALRAAFPLRRVQQFLQTR